MRKIICCLLTISFLSFAGIGLTERVAAEEQFKPVEINGTTWEIDLHAATKKGRARSEKDTLIFSEGKFTSKNFEAQGYSAVGYSVRVGNDNSTIWETMQTKEGKDRIFWRGVVDPQTMQIRGVFCKQSTRGQMQDFNFSGRLIQR